MIRFCFLIAIVTSLAGCSESPSESHRKILSQQANVDSYETLKANYSQRKRLEMDQALSSEIESNGKSKKRIEEFSLKMFRKFSTCKTLKLLDEEVTGNSAVLTYKNSDTCFTKEPNENYEIVHMVNEHGWKIDKVEIRP